MKEDLRLEALAQIQALEAEKYVKPFRERWLGGKLLDEKVAYDWLKEQALALLPDGAMHHGDEIDGIFPCISKEVISYSTEIIERDVAWIVDIAFNGSVYDRIILDKHYAEFSASALDDLGWLCASLADWFGKEWFEQAPLFVLCGRAPVLEPIMIEIVRAAKRERPGPTLTYQSHHAIGLRCRLDATEDDVCEAFKWTRNEARRQGGLSLRERAKPITSTRTRDLAVFGARIALGEFATWGAAMLAYSKEHPEDRTYTAAKDHGRFRRDVRRAYEAVTGLDLVWTPKRKGRPVAIRPGRWS